MTEKQSSAGQGERLAEALDLLEKCRPSHFDFSGALVHHEKPNGNELSFDPSCPKCVIPKAITLIRAALEAAAPAGTAPTKAEQALCEAALVWFLTPEVLDDYEALQDSESASAPAEFLLLCEIAKDVLKERVAETESK